ncbi:MAG: hypothetical protein RRB13_16680, partial [bacterium]|nr:hypothetical protein [bacterium]
WRANASFNPEAHRDKHVVWRVVTQVASRPRYNAQFTTYCQQWEPSKLTPLASTQVDHIKPPPPEIHHIAKDSIYCATSRPLYNRAFDIAVAGDFEAMQDLMSTKSVFYIEKDREVYIVDDSDKKALAIRPQGSKEVFWCLPGALKD